MRCYFPQCDGILAAPSLGPLHVNFLIHIYIPEFFEALEPEATVCLVAFTQPSKPPQECLLLTSDAGIDGGTVHAIKLSLADAKTDDADKIARQAFRHVQEYVRRKGMKAAEGVLLTAGLQEALEYWANSPRVTLAQLEQFVRTEA